MPVNLTSIFVFIAGVPIVECSKMVHKQCAIQGCLEIASLNDIMFTLKKKNIYYVTHHNKRYLINVDQAYFEILGSSSYFMNLV